MGYESRLYVVQKFDRSSFRDDGKCWADVIAVFNLSKVYSVSDIIRNKYPDTNCYLTEPGQDIEIVEDLYGSPLKEVPISDMINILENAIQKDDYRRFAPCLTLLKGFDVSQWGNIVVLHYGY